MKRILFFCLVLNAICGLAMAQGKSISTGASSSPSELAGEVARQKQACEDELRMAGDLVLAAFVAEGKRIQGMRWLPIEERVRRFHLLRADRIAFLSEGASPTMAPVRSAFAVFESKASLIKRRWVGFVDARLAALGPADREIAEALKAERGSHLQWTSSPVDSTQRVGKLLEALTAWRAAIDATAQRAATSATMMLGVMAESIRFDQAFAKAESELLDRVREAAAPKAALDPQIGTRIEWECLQAKWAFVREDSAAEQERPILMEFCRAMRQAEARFQSAMDGLAQSMAKVGLAESAYVLWCKGQKSNAIKDQLASGVSVIGKVVRGNWQIVNGEVLQDEMTPGPSLLAFGSETWSNYDLSLKARRENSKSSFAVAVHVSGDKTYRLFSLGGYGNKHHDLACISDGEFTRKKNEGLVLDGSLNDDQWYDLKVVVRAGTLRCYLDGKLLIVDSDSRFDRGRVGLVTWQAAARFRDIRITDPDGRLLWEGLPLLPD